MINREQDSEVKLTLWHAEYRNLPLFQGTGIWTWVLGVDGLGLSLLPPLKDQLTYLLGILKKRAVALNWLLNLLTM